MKPKILLPLTLRGNIISPACTIEAGSDGRTAYLGSWPAKMFTHSDAASDAAAFSVALSGCIGGVTKLTATFTGEGARAGNDLLQLDSPGQRKHVAIEIMDGAYKRVPLNTPFDASIPEKSEGYTFNFKARFVSIGGLP